MASFVAPFTYDAYFAAMARFGMPKIDALKVIIETKKALRDALGLAEGAEVAEASVANVAYSRALTILCKPDKN